MPNPSNCSYTRTLVAVLLIGLLSACATSGAGGWLGNAQASASPDVMWQDGVKAVETGEATLTQGEKRIAEGRLQVRDGEARIREGSTRASQAKLEYQRAAAAVTGASKAEQQTQANALHAIGLRWEAANQEIKNGNKMVATGNSSIARGEAEIRDGQSLMETGSVLMRNSHRSRLGQELLPLPATT